MIAGLSELVEGHPFVKAGAGWGVHVTQQLLQGRLRFKIILQPVKLHIGRRVRGHCWHSLAGGPYQAA